jgi:malate/lactate dehydrogenase
VARDGIKKKVLLTLSPEEEEKMQHSANVIKQVLQEITL